MNEAPFSWNTRYLTANGWTCQLTIRSDTGADLFDKVEKAVAWLTEKGCTPAEGYRTTSASSNGNGSTPPMCPTHGTPMKASKHGGGWYCPTKVADDDGTGKPVYCKQKVAA